MPQSVVFSWISVAAKDGAVLASLPDLTGSTSSAPTVALTMGQYETTTAELPLPTAPQNWERATLEGGSNLILLSQLYDSDDNPVGDPAPVWGGMVTTNLAGDGDTVPLSLATIESYLDRRYIRGKTYSRVGQNAIVKDLVDTYVGDAVGIPIRVQYVTDGDGKLRDQTYADSDDKSVYSALTDLMGIIGGPEWYIGWEHQTDPERYTPVLYVGDRIGSPVVPGFAPVVTFEMPGDATTAHRLRDYSSGKGANSVIAVSTASGDVRPQSDEQIFDDPDRPRMEYRYTPSTSIIDTDTLNDHAQSALVGMQKGAETIDLATAAVVKLGHEWGIGDDVGFILGTVDKNGVPSVPAFPDGYKGTARATGWSLALGSTPVVTPTLIEVD